MRNYPEWVIGYWATIALGAAAVGMNAWWTPPEMEYGLADSRPKVLIADDERVERVMPVLDDLRAVAPLPLVAVRTDRRAARRRRALGRRRRPGHAPATLPAADIDPDDDATIFYTSGTTGFPKGAQITHRGLGPQRARPGVLDAGHGDGRGQGDRRRRPAGAVGAARATGAARVHGADAAVPRHGVQLHAPPGTLAGGRIVLMRTSWDAGRALELIEREGVTNFSGVPTMGRELLAHPDFATP